MKLSVSFLLMAATGHAHYHFDRVIVNGTPEATPWTAVRMTKNYQTNAGVTDVNSPDMRCYQALAAGTATAEVAAGEPLGFVANAAVTHFGPVQFYMARVPDGADDDINTWDPAGDVWFKAASISAVPPLGPGEDTWPAYNKKSVEFTIPKALPNGKYLVRVESIALHQAQAVGGAQIYLSCAQVEVTGGAAPGSATPGPLVAFPGAYKASDPGLLWSYYPVPTSYTAPGPEVWAG
ncbi:glycoside hydrolase family 61 protein [Biscogniauxia mediterranea]|nr:glycoside hydrolase family 61 protein [Biscogniauxia mediterranea]